MPCLKKRQSWQIHSNMGKKQEKKILLKKRKCRKNKYALVMVRVMIRIRVWVRVRVSVRVRVRFRLRVRVWVRVRVTVRR